MALMTIRLELGRTRGLPKGDSTHGYEFIAPLNAQGHLDAEEWRSEKTRCAVRSFRPGQSDRRGILRHVAQGWRFDYLHSSSDDAPIFKLDRHVIAPGLYVTVTEEDGEQRAFKIASVKPVRASA